MREELPVRQKLKRRLGYITKYFIEETVEKKLERYPKIIHKNGNQRETWICYFRITSLHTQVKEKFK